MKKILIIPAILILMLAWSSTQRPTDRSGRTVYDTLEVIGVAVIDTIFISTDFKLHRINSTTIGIKKDTAHLLFNINNSFTNIGRYTSFIKFTPFVAQDFYVGSEVLRWDGVRLTHDGDTAAWKSELGSGELNFLDTLTKIATRFDVDTLAQSIADSIAALRSDIGSGEESGQDFSFLTDNGIMFMTGDTASTISTMIVNPTAGYLYANAFYSNSAQSYMNPGVANATGNIANKLSVNSAFSGDAKIFQFNNYLDSIMYGKADTVVIEKKLVVNDTAYFEYAINEWDSSNIAWLRGTDGALIPGDSTY